MLSVVSYFSTALNREMTSNSIVLNVQLTVNTDEMWSCHVVVIIIIIIMFVY